MRTVIVIPARYASSRLPGKPLLRHTGKYLVQHVYEQAGRAGCAAEVVIATDDPRIMAAARAFGGKAVMTRRDHPSGTDRIAEAARTIEADVIINLQGDEPLIDPSDLDRLADLMRQDPAASVATLAAPIRDEGEFLDPNVVKVVCDRNGRALYFSRSPIPSCRDGAHAFSADPPAALRHLGLYAYRKEALSRLAALPPCRLETAEKLEQLRILDRGWPVRVGVVEHGGAGVDTWDDYLRFVRVYRRLRGAAAAA